MTKILVVDDSGVDRKMAGGLLEADADWAVEYAENGREALEQLTNYQPDIIVTDLMMPEVDGLELVSEVRRSHSEVPVIIMTGEGTEATAIEALNQGAANYVPKAQLNDRLRDAVEEVLSIVRADRSYAQLVSCVDITQFQFTLDNNPLLIDPLVEMIQQMAAGMGLVDSTGRYRLGIALSHALLNALYRGNLEITSQQIQDTRAHLLAGQQSPVVQQRLGDPRYGNRKIHVRFNIQPEQGRFEIRDDGPGFDTSCVAQLREPEALESKSGRGLVLMQNFMDEVSFNETGNEVVMVKFRNR